MIIITVIKRQSETSLNLKNYSNELCILISSTIYDIIIPCRLQDQCTSIISI